MKKQIVVIHGGRAYSTYDLFLNHLRTRTIDEPLKQRLPGWKDSLQSRLGEEYEVYSPQMPNKENAKYEEWKIWFERYQEFLHDEVVLVGHSQGGYFLAKYLSENTVPVTVKAVFLVAGVFESDNFDGEDGGDFAFDTTLLPHLAEQVGKIFIFHSKDDPVVPYTHALKFKEALPDAKLITFENKGHFIIEEFPELVESIQHLH